ncbi:MAG: hemolysin family protein [Polyangiales bacterium]
MSFGAQVAVIVALTLANGFFAGAEIAMLAVRRGRLAERADEGSRGARLALNLRAQPERFLATVQVGITLIGATAAAFGGATIASELRDPLIHLGVSPELATKLALGIVVLAVSSLSIVLGELVPKSLALRHAERFTTIAAPILSAVAWFAAPIVWFLTATSNLLLRPFGDHTTFGETRLSPEELQQLVEEAATEGTVDRHASELASRALDLPTLPVDAVRVPRGDVVSIRRTHLREDLLAALGRAPHQRYPVVGENLEDATGYLVVHDVAALLAQEDSDLAAHVRPIEFVPETRRALEVMREMQNAGTHLALVIDEQGMVTGLLTLQDMLEELVGEILSEGEHAHHALERAEGGSVIAKGTARLREVNRALDLDLPEKMGVTTVGGLMVATLGRIPTQGTRVEIEGNGFEVLEASPRRVLSVRIRPKRTSR